MPVLGVQKKKSYGENNLKIHYEHYYQAEGEEPTKGTEKHLQFSCFIDKDVKYLHTGLKNRLQVRNKLYENDQDQDKIKNSLKRIQKKYLKKQMDKSIQTDS